jgi:hypothetical protein
MNEIAPISVIKTTKRSARCHKAIAPTPLSAAEVHQLQTELTHLRFELKTLKQATQDFVRYML